MGPYSNLNAPRSDPLSIFTGSFATLLRVKQNMAKINRDIPTLHVEELKYIISMLREQLMEAVFTNP
jgi:hypothetical protein